MIRKGMFGVEDATRLPESAYASEISDEVYRRLRQSAAVVLREGHAVIADAVFDREDSRAAVAALAGVPFDGVWLDVAPDIMRARLRARTRDVSDATPAVLDLQLGHDMGALDWHRVLTEGAPEAVGARTAAVLGLSDAAMDADPDLRLPRRAS